LREASGPLGLEGSDGAEGAEAPEGVEGAEAPEGVEGAEAAEGVDGAEGSEGVEPADGPEEPAKAGRAIRAPVTAALWNTRNVLRNFLRSMAFMTPICAH